MYKLYLDKQEVFEANIQIEGASTVNSLCRLILEHNNYSILFEGSIQNNIVKIPITSLKTVLKEGDTGKLRLEIIADDTFFQPWEQIYEVALSKKVTAEVIQGTTTEKKKSIIEVTSIKTSNSSDELINFELELNKALQENKITIYDINTKIKTVKKIVNELKRNPKFKSIDFTNIPLVDLILNNLKDK